MFEVPFSSKLEDSSHKPYNLTYFRDQDWKTSSRRVLIIVQTVDGRDLKNKALLSDKGTRNPLINSIKYARNTLAGPYLGDYTKQGFLPSSAHAIVAFNQWRHLHLKRRERNAAEAQFAQHVHGIIKKLQPTHILVSGDEAMQALFPDITNSVYKRGWVHEVPMKFKDGKLNVKVVSTLDFYRMTDATKDFANLLGFWCRHYLHLILGRHPHSIKGVGPNPVYVKTIEEVKKLFYKLRRAKHIGVDTETKNLSVLKNAILTIQFSLDTEKENEYVLAVDHPLAHWNDEEREYIKKSLKVFFSRMESDVDEEKGEQFPTLVTFNGMYDLRVIRQNLKIPIIWYPVWEIMAGEHLLDENISLLNSFTKGDATFGGLAPILCSYENDFYYTASFSKAERASASSIKPTDKGFLRYGAMDVRCLLEMRKQQIKRASYMMLAGKNYKPFFVRHMMYQMSDTVHQLSQLRQDGSLISLKYLKELLGDKSPLNTEANKLLEGLREYPEVREANDRLTKKSGFKAGSLFSKFGGKKADTSSWMFKWSKPDHKNILFIDILGLEPLEVSEKTGKPQLDKKFVEHYKDKSLILQDFFDFQVIEKLRSTYVKGWFKRLTTSLDGVADNHLRPDYSFWDVVTGRLNSSNPNLQNIPQRSSVAKVIKAMFVTPKGKLLIRYDYSAHEVRVWSIISGDKLLAAAFKAGQSLRKLFIAATDKKDVEEIKAEMKQKGDIHIQNVYRFFKKWVDKSDPLRDAIKNVVFGTLYGKSAKTLGEDTKTADRGALKKKITGLYKEQVLLEKALGVKKETAEVD